MHMIVSADLVD